MRQSLISLLLLVVLAACAPIPQPAQSPLPAPTATPAPVEATPTALPQPTPPTPQPPQAQQEGMGAISGRLSAPAASWEDQEITAYACPFTPNKEGTGGFFILEPTIHPHVVVAADGSFRIPNVPPGSYVIVAGPSPEESLAYRKTDQAAVIEVAADEVLDLGDIEVR
jgi:hypothetical protein